jgi:hypothetical protein
MITYINTMEVFVLLSNYNTTPMITSGLLLLLLSIIAKYKIK